MEAVLGRVSRSPWDGFVVSIVVVVTLSRLMGSQQEVMDELECVTDTKNEVGVFVEGEIYWTWY
jgi:hypothetical protein